MDLQNGEVDPHKAIKLIAEKIKCVIQQLPVDVLLNNPFLSRGEENFQAQPLVSNDVQAKLHY